MKKIILLAFLLAMAFAEQLDPGKAYIVSSINVNSTGQIESGKSYSLVPQIVVATGSENYAGSVTPFTGCYGGKRYENGSETGNCLTGVVNSLNSDSTTDALSAAQGKVLNDRTRINLLNPNLPTQTVNGVTITNNGDGTYTLNGTATDWVFVNLTPNKKYKGRAYRLVGCPKGGNDDWNLYMYDQTDNIDFGFDHGDGSTFKLIEGHAYVPVIRIKTGVTFNNTVFKPMLTTDLDATYDDFVPYQDSLATNQTVIDATRVNYLRPTLQTVTEGGITCTDNGDGTYTFNGTSTELVNFYFIPRDSYFHLKKGKYKFICSPEGSELVSQQGVHFVFKASEYDYMEEEDGNIINLSEDIDKVIYCLFQIRSAGITLNNFTIKPMITNDLNATYDDFVSFDDSLTTGANSGIKMDTLWENASPGASFAAQIVNLKTSEYRALIIEYRANAVSNSEYYTEILTTKNLSYLHFGFYKADYWSERYCEWTDTGVNFGNCKKNGTISNDYMVPYRIYGIK